jgi:hypothetical protein
MFDIELFKVIYERLINEPVTSSGTTIIGEEFFTVLQRPAPFLAFSDT